MGGTEEAAEAVILSLWAIQTRITPGMRGHSAGSRPTHGASKPDPKRTDNSTDGQAHLYTRTGLNRIEAAID